MTLSVSALAWQPNQQVAAAAVLNAHGVRYVDLIPKQCFPDFPNVTVAEVNAVRKRWQAVSIAPFGMQSLFFGSPSFSIFDLSDCHRQLSSFWQALGRVAQDLGVTKLTFGSPKMRLVPSDLSDTEQKARAHDFLLHAADLLAPHGATLCLEPVFGHPVTVYGSTLRSCWDTVTSLGHPNLKAQIDTGSVFADESFRGGDFAATSTEIGHIHLSEAGLIPFAAEGDRHTMLAKWLSPLAGRSVFTIEYLCPQQGDDMATLSCSIERAKQRYIGRSVS